MSERDFLISKIELLGITKKGKAPVDNDTHNTFFIKLRQFNYVTFNRGI